MTQSVVTKAFKRRKFLKPDQRVRIWSHHVKEALLSAVGSGLANTLAGMPKKVVVGNDVLGWFSDAQLHADYDDLSRTLKPIEDLNRTNSTPEHDCWILYALSRATHARTALEIGTHLGYSTLHIAAGLRDNGSQGQLTTVDRQDVNDESRAAYRSYGADMSAISRLKKMQLDGKVQFVVSPSDVYLSATRRTFDFIFIDGDHSEVGAYFDMVGSLKVLNDGGIIVLHDYHDPDDSNPEFSYGQYGVYWAIKKLQFYRKDLTVLPLRDIVAPRTQGDPPTSLAILTRAG